MRAEHITPPRDSEIFHKVPQTFEELLREDRRTAEILLSTKRVSQTLQQHGIKHCFIGGIGVFATAGPHRRIKDADLLVLNRDYYDARSILDTLPGTFLPIPGAEYILQPPAEELGYDSPDGVKLKLFQFDEARSQFGTERHGIKIQTEIPPVWDKTGTVCGIDILHPGIEFMRFTKLQQLKSRQVTAAQQYDARLLGLMHLM